eukprot:CAMPEP_0203878950 /NCGR_PEP_ID=MMETSP0359-20131031/23459_1 /ASSEMBLY_ACC=CAM_ASM_000338 /TAXON_ID=268821 /ORGANISM="Scrippsiella Hangoei, Strain SHTV-5" /LENGTH=119 /DNA_ID=CAMNT_0050798265 /DNA_START=62 /DNA_END=417 /DNA_ORIENTATION=+
MGEANQCGEAGPVDGLPATNTLSRQSDVAGRTTRGNHRPSGSAHKFVQRMQTTAIGVDGIRQKNCRREHNLLRDHLPLGHQKFVQRQDAYESVNSSRRSTTAAMENPWSEANRMEVQTG